MTMGKNPLKTLMAKGLWIPRKPVYSLQEVDQIKQQQINDFNEMLARFNAARRVIDKVNAGLRSVDRAKEPVLTATLFVAAPDWKTQLGKLRDKFNDTVSETLDIIREAREEAKALDKGYAVPVNKLLDYGESIINEQAGMVNDAVREAIGGDDGGQALQLIAGQLNESLSDMFNAEYRQMNTEALATERRFSRAGVYIGVNCLLKERDGITSIRKQWRAVYKHLQVRSNELADDALEAYQYFNHYKPFNLTGKKLHQFEQKISRYKTEMRPHFDSIGQSHDKVATTHRKNALY